MNRRTALAVAALPLVAGTLAGCGSSSSRPDATHVMPDGQTMSGSSMPGSGGMEPLAAPEGSGTGAAGPSAAAAMVCSDETRDAVALTLQLDRAPHGLHSWAHDRYRCSYLLGAGELRLSVEDLDVARTGRAYFDDLRARLPLTSSLRGVESLGLAVVRDARGRRGLPQGPQDSVGRRRPTVAGRAAHRDVAHGRRLRRRGRRRRLLVRVKSCGPEWEFRASEGTMGVESDVYRRHSHQTGAPRADPRSRCVVVERVL